MSRNTDTLFHIETFL